MKVNDIIKCKVTGLKSFGVFGVTDSGETVFCHISKIANKFVSNINDEFVLGQVVNAKIINIDENNRIEVSFKDAVDVEPIPTTPEPRLNVQKQAKTEFKHESNINSSPNTKQSFEDMLNSFLKTSDDKQKSLASRNMKRKKH